MTATTTVEVRLGSTVIGPRSVPEGIEVGEEIALDASDVRYRVVDLADGVSVEPVALTATPAGSALPSGRREIRVASTGGVDIALHDLGGVGPTVLICHATGFHGFAYAPFARALASNHHVFAVDLRGHGGSTPPASEDFDWEGMADDIHAVRSELPDGPVHAVGHSMGGAAIVLAERRTLGTIRSAWLYEPIIFPEEFRRSLPESPLVRSAAARRAEFPSRQAAFERYGSRPPLSELRTDALAAYVQHGFVDQADGVRLACEPAHESATFAAAGGIVTEDVAEMTLPIMVGIGRGADTPGPAMMAAALAQLCPNVDAAPSLHLGHFGPLEAPDELAAQAADFFARS